MNSPIKDQFIKANFLLQNKAGFRLYYEYAVNCPIIDYHCHLSPGDIAQDRQFKDLTELWLEGDHYKWRAMRANGIEETHITGAATNKEKFKAWAATVPYTLRNPLYHWTHLELYRYFEIQLLLSPETASEIYKQANALINTSDFSAQALLKKMNVEVVCTSDDPTDDLTPHKKLKQNFKEIKVLPTWRPDPLLQIQKTTAFKTYLRKLEKAANKTILTFQDLMDAVKIRQNYFHENGCRLADHGLNTFIAVPFTLKKLYKIFNQFQTGKTLSEKQIKIYQSGMMYLLAIMNHEKGWIQQFHVGPIRNTNSRLETSLGPDTGFDSIGSSLNAGQMALFFDRLDAKNQLSPTICYNSSPVDNYMFVAMAGNFQDGSIPGKMQHGAAWWFLDQKEGIEMQLNALSNLGLLRRFVGMVTDSRSFLSYPRHEYFRRILCNMLGAEMENGLLPNDFNLIGEMVKDICYNNAKNYFSFEIG